MSAARARAEHRLENNHGKAKSGGGAKVMASGTEELAKAIDVVEETYEYMLAYAAQGRSGGDEDDSIRDYLKRAEAALGVIAAATAQSAGSAPGDAADEAFLDIVRTDAARARAAMRFVLARRSHRLADGRQPQRLDPPARAFDRPVPA